MPLPEAAREERAAWLHLVLTPDVGPATARDLLSAFGLPEQILAAGHAALRRVVPEPVAQALRLPPAVREQAVARTLAWARAPDHHLVTLIDPAYPPGLLQIGDPPPLLYVRGDPSVLRRPALAIVGSRSGSRGGLQTAEAFARALGEAGLTIVSGLALGVDAAAHRGAMHTRAGTVAVLGTGLDRPYPPAHAGLADEIVAAGGAVISELPLGTDARRAQFPRRNRLIAGLAQGVLVVEAALRSGSLITARLAGEFGREVLAIPGSIHSPLSKGCHQLIKQGAKLVESAQDVLSELPATPAGAGGASTGRPARPGAARPGAGHHGAAGAPAGNPLLDALGWDPVGADALADAGRAAGLAPAALAGHLLALELDGQVERLPDGRYQRRPPST